MLKPLMRFHRLEGQTEFHYHPACQKFSRSKARIAETHEKQPLHRIICTNCTSLERKRQREWRQQR